jgi:hypothetical protein
LQAEPSAPTADVSNGENLLRNNLRRRLETCGVMMRSALIDISDFLGFAFPKSAYLRTPTILKT